MKEISRWKNFDGDLVVFEHDAKTTQSVMTFAVFIPPQAKEKPVPVLWYLSGLTCTWANVMEKSGIQAYAAKHGVIVVAPDTSPRGENIPDNEQYDLGQGAGFYLSATEQPWAEHYQMDTYITEELQQLIINNFPVDDEKQGVLGHSMGGHGAITLFLKHQELYKSCSAFSPILSPSDVPWGQKAFQAYLGSNKDTWQAYDATQLVKSHQSEQEILIDQGSEDQFLSTQLPKEDFLAAANEHDQAVMYRLQAGYDHSYYFVASFMEEHIAWHVSQLKES